MFPLVFLLAALSALPARADLEPGLTVRVFDAQRPLERVAPPAPDQTPNSDRRFDRVDFRNEASFGGPAECSDYFVVEAIGWLVIERDGPHEFLLRSDDGATFALDGRIVVDNGGVHAPRTARGAIELDAGLHSFRILMFENDGGAELSLSWQRPGDAAFSVVPADVFRVERGVTRVVSPGRKTILDGREHLRPGDGLPLESVHPTWVVEPLRPAGFEPQVGGMGFLPDGRLALTSFKPVNNGVFREEPNGSLWILDGVVGGTPETIRATMIADDLHDPAGLEVVDGAIYVAQRHEITRFEDRDGNGSFESRERFAHGWVSDNYHHFTFGLEAVTEPARGGAPPTRWLYGSLSTSIYFDNTMKHDGVKGDVVSMNGPNPLYRGTCFRIRLDSPDAPRNGTQDRPVEYVCGGFRTPNGVGAGPMLRGEPTLFVTDNQGAWLPASKLVRVKPERFYGHANGAAGQSSEKYPQGGFPSLFVEQGATPPTVWLPQNECANSPSEPLLIRRGPFAGQLYVAELTMGGVRRVFLEEVGGELQGCAFQFTQGLECGANRLIEGPDGALYVGGIGSDGNWSWRNTRFGLERLRPVNNDGSTSEPFARTAFEYHSIRALSDGFQVRFTRAVDRAWLADSANYTITQWHYTPTPQYGGEKQDETLLAVESATPADDGRSVHLVIRGRRPGSVVRFRIDPVSIDGERMWATEAWYTLNRIP